MRVWTAWTVIALGVLFIITLVVLRKSSRRMGGDLLYEVNGTVSYELRLPLHAM